MDLTDNIIDNVCKDMNKDVRYLTHIITNNKKEQALHYRKYKMLKKEHDVLEKKYINLLTNMAVLETRKNRIFILLVKAYNFVSTGGLFFQLEERLVLEDQLEKLINEENNYDKK